MIKTNSFCNVRYTKTHSTRSAHIQTRNRKQECAAKMRRSHQLVKRQRTVISLHFCMTPSRSKKLPTQFPSVLVSGCGTNLKFSWNAGNYEQSYYFVGVHTYYSQFITKLYFTWYHHARRICFNLLNQLCRFGLTHK